MTEAFQLPVERQLNFGFSTPLLYETSEQTALYNVSSDDDSPFILHIATHNGAFGDVWFQIQDPRFTMSPDELVHMPNLRFRHDSGGGLNPFISEELYKIPRSFLNHIEMDVNKLSDDENEDLHEEEDRINANTTIKVYRDSRKNWFKITDISHDDTDGKLDDFLDIEVTENGNVVLTQRHTEYKLDGNIEFPVEVSGSMLFKSRENGGQNPQITEILRGLAVRIAKAVDPRVKR
ncbi:MAG TPA: hypothetical protein VG965_01565 [Patescibacteria group bacterium]|nr:hypothetical protein [Patescibacteria group bacterium]